MGRAEPQRVRDRQAPPFCSIITVTRNNLPGLQATARSVNAQSSSDYEWIVIDGGSDDGSKDYLKNTKAQWISEPDKGIYDAMNKGLRMAGGEYVLFLNAGDVFASEVIISEIKIALIYKNIQPDFIYGDAIEDSHPKMARSHKNLAAGMFTHHQAMLYRRASLGGLHYDISYEIAADYDFTCRFLNKEASVFYFPMPVCIFETGGISQQQVKQGRKEQSDIRKKVGLCGNFGNSLIEIRQTIGWLVRKYAGGIYWYIKGFQFR